MQLLPHLLYVAVGRVVDEKKIRLEALAYLDVGHHSRVSDTLSASFLHERYDGTPGGLRWAAPKCHVAHDKRSLPLVILDIEVGVAIANECPHAPLVPAVDGNMKRRVPLFVDRIG